MDITTTARIQVWKSEASATKLTVIIAEVSRIVERYLDRTLLAGTFTATYDVEDGQNCFPIKAYPATISAVTDDGTAVASTYYGLSGENQQGYLLKFYGYVPTAGKQTLVIAGTGGMAATTAAFVTAYPDIVGAVDRWVLAIYNRMPDVHLESITTQDVSRTLVDFTMPDYVKDALDSYRRILA